MYQRKTDHGSYSNEHLIKHLLTTLLTNKPIPVPLYVHLSRHQRGVAMVGLFVGWLLNVPAKCECISGTDLL